MRLALKKTQSTLVATPIRMALFGFCLTTASLATLIAQPPNTFKGGSKPVFEARFTQDIDPAIWQVLHQPGHNGGQPGFEQQLYIPGAVKTDDKGLHLIGKRQEEKDPKSGKLFYYTSGRIESNQQFLYGYFEFEAQLPAGPGFWPAIWLRSKEDKPTNGEIDVIEGYGNHPNAFRSTVHHWDNGKHVTEYCVLVGLDWRKDESCESATKTLNGPLPDLSKAYHTYAVEWLPDHITWLFDGTPYFTVREYVTNVPMRIVLNFAMGARFDGPITDNTPFPSSLDIRRVRVWSHSPDMP